MQEGVPMVSMNLSSRECDGRAVVALRGELDVVDAASVAAALTAVAGRAPEMIVDFAGPGVIESTGLAAPVLPREHGRQAGGSLLLSPPRNPVLQNVCRPPLAAASSRPSP